MPSYGCSRLPVCRLRRRLAGGWLRSPHHPVLPAPSSRSRTRPSPPPPPSPPGNRRPSTRGAATFAPAAAYAYAKQGAGPLRPGVDHVEGTVEAVVGPVYDRFHAVPLDLLKFLDRKMLLDVVSVYNKVTDLTDRKQSVKISIDEVQEGDHQSPVTPAS